MGAIKELGLREEAKDERKREYADEMYRLLNMIWDSEESWGEPDRPLMQATKTVLAKIEED